MVVENVLSTDEADEIWKQVWTEQFEGERTNGSIHDFSFMANRCLGEKRLEKLGHLELYRRTQRLPEYVEAENTVRQGWICYNKMTFGVSEGEGRDNLKIRQAVLLYGLRRASTPDAWQRLLCGAGVPCMASAERGDTGFFIRLGRTLSDISDDAPRQEDPCEFAQLLLEHWLTSFLWLMPLKAAANVLAKIQGVANDPTGVDRIGVRIRQAKSRLPWRHYFYSRRPPLIDCIEDDGSPILTASGKRLLTD